MRYARLAAGTGVAVVLGIGISVAAVTAHAMRSQAAGAKAEGAARAPRNAAEFDEMFNKVKNWGRWGKEDQLGAINLITDAKRKQAIALAKNGITVSLSHDLMKDKAEDNPTPFGHVMSKSMTTDT